MRAGAQKVKEELDDIRTLITDNQGSMSSVVHFLSQIQDGVKKLNDDMHLWVTAQLSGGGVPPAGPSSPGTRLTPTSEDASTPPPSSHKEHKRRTKTKSGSEAGPSTTVSVSRGGGGGSDRDRDRDRERERKLTISTAAGVSPTSPSQSWAVPSPEFMTLSTEGQGQGQGRCTLEKEPSVRSKDSAEDENRLRKLSTLPKP